MLAWDLSSTAAAIGAAPAAPACGPSVLLIGNFLSHLGGRRAVGEDLAERLRARGWRILQASTAANRLARLADMGWTAWRRRHEYNIAQVEVFSGRAFVWAEAACWVLRRTGHRYVLTLHGGNLPDFARRWPGRVSRLLRSAIAVTAPSPYLVERMAPYREGILALPNGLDVRAYGYRSRTRAAPRLVWLRAFEKTYNPQMAVQVVALLRQEFAEIRLTMIGPDKGDGSLRRTRQLAEQLGVSGQVRFADGVSKAEVPHRLNEADIFLNTTNIDNTPVSVLEAMACGLCVVGTDAGGLPYLLEDGQDARLVPCNDAEAMAASVRQILLQPELAARLSRKARQKAEQCDWSVVLPQWEKLLSSAAKP